MLFFQPKTYWSKIVSVNAMKEYGGSTGIGKLIYNLGILFRWVVSLMPRPFNIRGNDPRYPLSRKLGRPQNQSGCFGEVIHPLPQPGLEPRIVQPIA
jgi:hypothetical protein